MNRIVSHHGKINLPFGQILDVPMQLTEVKDECRSEGDVRQAMNPRCNFHPRGDDDLTVITAGLAWFAAA